MLIEMSAALKAKAGTQVFCLHVKRRLLQKLTIVNMTHGSIFALLKKKRSAHTSSQVTTIRLTLSLDHSQNTLRISLNLTNAARTEKEMLVSRLQSKKQEPRPGTRKKRFAVVKVQVYANGFYEVIKNKHLRNMKKF